MRLVFFHLNTPDELISDGHTSPPGASGAATVIIECQF